MGAEEMLIVASVSLTKSVVLFGCVLCKHKDRELRYLCAVSVVAIKSRSSETTVRYTDNKSSSFTVLSELISLLLNCKAPYCEGAIHLEMFYCRIMKKNGKVTPVYCTTSIMRKSG